MKNNRGSIDVTLIIFALFVIVVVAGLLLAFTPKSLTKNFGGTVTIELEPGEKLEEITWKDDSIWYLTRPMRDDETAEIHTFSQSSPMGVLEGKVIVIEHEEDESDEK